jgi:hypothetical protein
MTRLAGICWEGHKTEYSADSWFVMCEDERDIARTWKCPQPKCGSALVKVEEMHDYGYYGHQPKIRLRYAELDTTDETFDKLAGALRNALAALKKLRSIGLDDTEFGIWLRAVEAIEIPTKRAVKRKCPNCSKVFIGKSDKRFCSSKCTTSAAGKRLRAKRRLSAVKQYEIIMRDLLRERDREGPLTQTTEAFYAALLSGCWKDMTDEEQADMEKRFSAVPQ